MPVNGLAPRPSILTVTDAMRTLLSTLGLVLAFVAAPAVAFVAAPAVAQEPPTGAGGPAQTFMQARDTSVREIMHRPTRTAPQREARTTALTQALHDLLDYDELARRSLAEHFATATPAQRTAFVDLLRQLVERSYRKNLDTTMSYQISWLGESATDGGRLVRTSARSRTNGREPAVSIDYSLHQVGTGWKVFDIATDGQSLLRTYRRDFHRIIRDRGFDGLLQRMRDKLAQADD